MRPQNNWIQVQAQLEGFFYSSLENRNLRWPVTESLLSEKKVRLRHYFVNYFGPKAPRFFRRMINELTRDEIIEFMSRFLSSDEFARRIPERLFSGSLLEQNLAYNFLPLWSVIDYLENNRQVLGHALRRQALANAMVDAAVFDLVWRRGDLSDLRSRSDVEGQDLGFRKEFVILTLEAFPDLSMPLKPLSAVAQRKAFFAFNTQSTVENIEFIDVTSFVQDPSRFRNAAIYAGLLEEKSLERQSLRKRACLKN